MFGSTLFSRIKSHGLQALFTGKARGAPEKTIELPPYFQKMFDNKSTP